MLPDPLYRSRTSRRRLSLPAFREMALIVAILRTQQGIGIGGNVNALVAGELSLRPCDRILCMSPGPHRVETDVKTGAATPVCARSLPATGSLRQGTQCLESRRQPRPAPSFKGGGSIITL